MDLATLERPMAEGKRARKPKRSDRPKRDDKAVKIDRTLADKAAFVASRRGLTLAEYLSEMVRSPVERDFAKAIKEMGAG